MLLDDKNQTPKSPQGSNFFADKAGEDLDNLSMCSDSTVVPDDI